MLKFYLDWVLENFNSSLTLCHAGKELLLTELGNPVFKTIQKLSKVLNVFNKVTGKINITKVKANNSVFKTIQKLSKVLTVFNKVTGKINITKVTANNSTQFWAIIDTSHPPLPPNKRIFQRNF
jgi:predicted TIM-barrel fold metal-dependent hydrolase